MDKLMVIIVIGILAVILFDTYSKHAESQAKSDIEAQRVAQQNLLQMQMLEGRDQPQRGFVGGILGSIPLLGGLF